MDSSKPQLRVVDFELPEAMTLPCWKVVKNRAVKTSWGFPASDPEVGIFGKKHVLRFRAVRSSFSPLAVDQLMVPPLIIAFAKTRAAFKGTINGQ